MEYLVYDTEEAALAEESIIFWRGADIAAQNGYVVDTKGIVGKPIEGTTRRIPRTVRWDIPTQAEDGKWLILHPKYHDAAKRWEAWLIYVMDGIVTPVETR